MRTRTRPRDLPLVWARLTVYMLEPKPADAQKDLCQRLDHFLDELANEDAFGTEGQCDPRGDQRD